MKLVVIIVALAVLVSQRVKAGTRWNSLNCPNGTPVDAVCCEDDHCQKPQDESSCNADPTCLWNKDKCTSNRDELNNVCCKTELKNDMCASVAKGRCPADFQVPAGCCSKEGLHWEGILTVNKTGFVCCNHPCKDMEKMGCEVLPRCHPRSNVNTNYNNLGFRSGLLDRYNKGPYSNKVGQVMQGLSFSGSYDVDSSRIFSPGSYVGYYGEFGPVYEGYGGYGSPFGPQPFEPFPGKSFYDDDFSKELHVDEITVDDLMNSLIEALSSDNDVFTFNQEVQSDPLFRKQKFGGFVDTFNFVNPEFFFHSIYGTPYTYDVGYEAYGYGPVPPPPCRDGNCGSRSGPQPRNPLQFPPHSTNYPYSATSPIDLNSQ